MSFEPVPEAELESTDGGLTPATSGWFVVNVEDTKGIESERFGRSCRFENPSDHPFPEFGINIRVLEPGQPASLYHRENAQEAFLVLNGECELIVEEQRRPLRKGDFVHLPYGTAHVLVGAGSGPSTVLMVGTRVEEELLYPVCAAAAEYGASAATETSDASEAYGRNELRPTRLGLPW